MTSIIKLKCGKCGFRGELCIKNLLDRSSIPLFVEEPAPDRAYPVRHRAFRCFDTPPNRSHACCMEFDA